MGSLMKQSAIAGLALLLSIVAPGAAQEERVPARARDAVARPTASGPELPRSRWWWARCPTVSAPSTSPRVQVCKPPSIARGPVT